MSGAHVGSAGEEAARLFAAVEQWARSRRGLLDDDHLATGAAECTVCPLCSGVAALRSVQPETVEHLLDAAASVVAALRSAVAPTAPSDGHRHGSGDGPVSGPGQATRVQHIDVREG